MLAELKLKLWNQEMQPIEAYPVLFHYTRNTLIYRPQMNNELSTNIIYKN